MAVRNKWKKSYDDKVEALLGMNASSAKSRLERMMLLHAYRKLGLGKCSHCGFDILSVEDVDIDHIKPWGGNIAKGIEPDVKLHWDMENVRLAHQRCNRSAGCGGSGYYKYVGAHPIRNRKNKQEIEYVRSGISVNAKEITLGYYKTSEEAAIAYDLGIMCKFDGIGKLNFEILRNKYTEKLNSYNVKHRDFWQIRNGPFKKIVKELYSSSLEEINRAKK